MTTNAKNLVSELLPCPYCGGIGEIDQYRNDESNSSNRWTVSCKDFECFGYITAYRYSRKIDAINAWNTRAPMLAQADDVRRKCAMCRGVGSHGEPPMPCRWCKGTGNDGLQSQASDAVSEPIGYTSQKNLEQLRKLHGEYVVGIHRIKTDGFSVPVYTTPPHDDGKVARDAEPTAADLAELNQIAVDFDDCEETQASDQTLRRLVSLDLLECIRYNITAKGLAAIKEQRE